MLSQPRTQWLVLVLTSLLVVGCGGAPRLLSRAPRATEGPRLVAEGSTAPRDGVVAHRAYWEIEASQPEAAVATIEQVALNHSGYSVRSQQWLQDGQTHATVTIAVPIARYAGARNALLGVGTLLEESAAGEQVVLSEVVPSQQLLTHLTIQVHPPAASQPPSPVPSTVWRPVQTFRAAFGVSSSIVLLFLDVLIWTVVILVPMWLLAMSLRTLRKRLSRQ